MKQERVTGFVVPTAVGVGVVGVADGSKSSSWSRWSRSIS